MTIQIEDTLYLIQLKASTVTHDASNEAQDLRSLNKRINDYRRMHTPSVRNYKPVIGIIRGQRSDREKTYPGTMSGTEDLAGFKYREIVGKALFTWLLGHDSDVQKLIQTSVETNTRLRSELAKARCDALQRLLNSTNAVLRRFSLNDELGSLVQFMSLLPDGNPKLKSYKDELNKIIAGA